jgi:hypothetical protein
MPENSQRRGDGQARPITMGGVINISMGGNRETQRKAACLQSTRSPEFSILANSRKIARSFAKPHKY